MTMAASSYKGFAEPSQFTALRSAASSSSTAASSQTLTKRRQTLPAYNDNCERVQKYKDHFSFLRNSKFLQDLENDSVDSDIIEEELSALQEVPSSTREKVAKFLQSNPVQILLCVIVLLDAGIVIAQILLDLNSVKDKLHRRDLQLSSLLKYIRDTQPGKLHGYTGDDVDLILRMLREEESSREEDDGGGEGRGGGGRGGLNRTTTTMTTMMRNNLTMVHDRNRHFVSMNRTQATKGSGSGGGSGSGSGGGGGGGSGSGSSNGLVSESVSKRREDHTLSAASMVADYQHHVEEGEHDLLHEVAHGLHFASIALLGFLVIEDLIKILAMGRTFFKHKIEIFDAVIIVSSFAIDIVFLGGVSGEEGQKAAAVLVILLLWRIARVVDGIVVTVKQRQEFRIRLQKRARRIAEKKLESFEEERHSKTRQIEALKDLCTKAGITDDDIAACAPVDPKRVNTTLCALSSVARLSVSMTMLMSSGVYRPRLLDERIVLPKMFNPRTSKDHSPTAAGSAAGAATGSGPARRSGVLPRIESLPIMKNSYMSGSASKKQQRRHRKSASGKIYRKNDEEAGERGRGGRGAGAGCFKDLPSSTSIEATEDCSHVTIESTTSSGTSGPEMDRRRSLAEEESPVNSSGVHIIIDRGSDVEINVLTVREVAEEDDGGSSSCPHPDIIVGPRSRNTDKDDDSCTVRDKDTGPANAFSRDFSESGRCIIESEVGSGSDAIVSLYPTTSPQIEEASHGSTLRSDPSCKSATNAPESCKSSSSDQGSSSNFDSTPASRPGTSNGPTPRPNNIIIEGLINNPMSGPSKGPSSRSGNTPTQGPSNSIISGPGNGPTPLGSSPGSEIDPSGFSSDPGLCLSSDHAHRELVRGSDSPPSNSQSVLLSDI